MANDFPPILPGKIPAQVNSKVKFTFQPNPSVGTSKNKIDVRIFAASTGKQLHEEKNVDVVYINNIGQVTLTSVSLSQGQYYKIQVAYSGSKYWSNVGVFKYTAQYVAYDAGAAEGTQWYFLTDELELKVTLKSNDDTEPLYSYEYLIFDSDGQLVHQKEIIVTDSNRMSNYFLCNYQPNFYFNRSDTYTIKFKYTTLNGFSEEKLTLYLKCSRTTEDVEDSSFNVIIDKEKGKNFINFAPDTDKKYRLIKYCNNKYQVLTNYKTDNLSFYDLSLDHGDAIYRIEKLETFGHPKDDDGNVTNATLYILQYKIQSISVFIDFEHISLNDNEKILCIKYNPKISSFKETVLETKTDTIGSKYPFFFRNGNTGYKEFSINGLISYHMDTEESFGDYNLGVNHKRTKTPSVATSDNTFIPSTNLTGRNIEAERKFKEEVLKWLNNGKPKLFRSPTEGSYLVRLMNISLSPEEQLGRMLHSFQATAYEIAECTPENLVKYNCQYQGG